MNNNNQEIIYEINLSIIKINLNSYLIWLKDFIENQMLKIDGFISSEIFLIDNYMKDVYLKKIK